MLRCPNCGSRYDEGRFCARDGTPLVPETVEPPPPPDGPASWSAPPPHPSPTAGRPAPGPRPQGRLPKAGLVAVIVVACLALVAGAAFAVPAVMKAVNPPEPANPATPGAANPAASGAASTAAPETPAPTSFVYGHQVAWTLTPSDLGVPDGSDASMYANSESGATWLVNVRGDGGGFVVHGVDAATGAPKWQLNSRMTSCVDQALDGVFYCANRGDLYAIDADTGQSKKLARLFARDNLGDTRGKSISVSGLSDDGEYSNYSITVIGGGLFAFYDDFSTETILTSKISPEGKAIWTTTTGWLRCRDVCPWPASDAAIGGLLILNSSSEVDAVVLDEATGKTLLTAPCGLRVLGEGQLWSDCKLRVPEITTSSGERWTVMSPLNSSEPEESREFVVEGWSDAGMLVTATTGSVSLWKAGQSIPAWTTVVDLGGEANAAHFGDQIVLVDSTGAAWSLSAATGEVQWRASIPVAERNETDEWWSSTTPEVAIPDEKVVLAYSPGTEQSNGTMFALDARTGTVAWLSTEYDGMSVVAPESGAAIRTSTGNGTIIRLNPVRAQE